MPFPGSSYLKRKESQGAPSKEGSNGAGKAAWETGGRRPFQKAGVDRLAAGKLLEQLSGAMKARSFLPHIRDRRRGGYSQAGGHFVSQNQNRRVEVQTPGRMHQPGPRGQGRNGTRSKRHTPTGAILRQSSVGGLQNSGTNQRPGTRHTQGPRVSGSPRGSANSGTGTLFC